MTGGIDYTFRRDACYKYGSPICFLDGLDSYRSACTRRQTNCRILSDLSDSVQQIRQRGRYDVTTSFVFLRMEETVLTAIISGGPFQKGGHLSLDASP